jgi:hypothetical protein
MDLLELLRSSAQAVESAGLAEEFRVAGFEKAFDYLAGVQGPGLPGDNLVLAKQEPRREVDQSSPLSQIASRLSLPVDVVEDVYFEDGELLGLGVASSSIDPKKAGGTKQLALLYVAGLQTGGWEEWTAVDSIRAVCSEYGRYDDSNFATTLGEMGDVFQFRGSRRSREVRLKRPGLEAASRLVSRLAGREV